MTGDVMISAAFLTYCGFFDQLYRQLLTSSWQKYMEDAGLKHKKELSLSEFLSTASERVFW
jgi:dynein heavy chain 1